MSALDFTARALALRAAAQAPLSFPELCAAKLPASVTRIESVGHGDVGLGAGSYVADASANAALQAEHPSAVFAGAQGRFFRLTGGATGFVTPEQFGCPAHAPGVNAQPYIQAAVRYAEAFGYGVMFPQEDYELWTPVRTPVGGAWDGGEEVRNGNGHPICINRRVEFLAGPRGTRFHRKTWQGRDPAVFANTQTMADSYGYGYWRGGMFALIGKTSAPADRNDLASLVLRGKWQILGGLPKSANPGLYSPNSPFRLHPTGDGWDVYDRPIWATADKHTGDVELHGDILIDGFRGEVVFRGGLLCGNIIQRGRLTCSNGDANVFDGAWRPDQVVDCENIVAEKVYMFCERAIGYQSRFGKITLRDVGPASSGWAAGLSFDEVQTDYVQARVTIDELHLERCGTFNVGRNISINRVTCVDGSISVGAYNQSAWNVHIGHVDLVSDRSTVPGVVIYASNSDTAGAMRTRSNHIGSIHCRYTPYAEANGKGVTQALDWKGSLGPENFVGEITGKTWRGAFSNAAYWPTTTDYQVGVGDISGLTVLDNGAMVAQNAETAPAIAYRAVQVQLTTTTADAHVTYTLPNMTNKLPRGSVLVLHANPAGANGWLSVATANTNLPTRVAHPKGRTLTFKWEGNHWRLLDPKPKLTGSLTANLQKGGAAIPAGDVSDEVTLAVSGARAGMSVKVTPNTVISGDALLAGRVTADNTVGIRARNVNLGAALALGSATYKLELEWAS